VQLNTSNKARKHRIEVRQKCFYGGAIFLGQNPQNQLLESILFSSQRIKKPPLCSITNRRSNGKVIGGFFSSLLSWQRDSKRPN